MVLRNGELVEKERALVSLDDIDVAYGYGVYETLKVRKGVLYFPEFHEQRLMNSAKILGIYHELKPGDLIRGLKDLVYSAKPPETGLADWNIKVMLMGHSGAPADLYAFLLNPLFPDRKQLKHGGRVSLFMGERHFPQAKSLSMLMSTIAFRQAHELDCYDALLVNHRNEITEGTRTNMFFLPNDEGLDSSEDIPWVDRVFTPPVKDVLDGITRKTIIQALEARGIVCIEKPLTLDMLFSGRVSLWLSSTSTKIMPIREVRNPIGAQNYSGPNHALNPEVLRHYPESFSLPVHPSIRSYQKIYDEYLKEYSESITHGSDPG